MTYMPLVPPVIVLLNNSDILKKYDLSSVIRVGSGAAPLAKDTEEEFAGKLGVGELRQGQLMYTTEHFVSSLILWYMCIIIIDHWA